MLLVRQELRKAVCLYCASEVLSRFAKDRFAKDRFAKDTFLPVTRAADAVALRITKKNIRAAAHLLSPPLHLPAHPGELSEASLVFNFDQEVDVFGIGLLDVIEPSSDTRRIPESFVTETNQSK